MKKKSGLSFSLQFKFNKKILLVKESLLKASMSIYPNVSKDMVFRIENTYLCRYTYSQNSHILCTLVRAMWCAKVLFIYRCSKIGKKKVWAIICLYKTITKIAGKWDC